MFTVLLTLIKRIKKNFRRLLKIETLPLSTPSGPSEPHYNILQKEIRDSWKCAGCRKPVGSDFLYFPGFRDDHNYIPKKFLCANCLITKELFVEILNLRSSYKQNIKIGRVKKKDRGIEYGWAVTVKIEEARKGLPLVIRGVHRRAIRSLWKGAIYELGLMPTKTANVIVYFYHNQLMCIGKLHDQREIPKKKWPRQAVEGQWLVKKFKV